VLSQCDRDQYGLHTIGAEYLPQIDDSVDIVFWLVLLYQHVQSEVLNPGVHLQQVIKPAFTTQQLAYYLFSKCSNVASSTRHKITKPRQQLSWTKSPILCDMLLFKQMKRQLDKCPSIEAVSNRTDDVNNASSSIDTSLLVTTLELVALEKLIALRQVMVCELHSEQFPVLNEFKALYLYKCGLFGPAPLWRCVEIMSTCCFAPVAHETNFIRY